MPTYINIAPSTKVHKDYIFRADRTYCLPYSSSSIAKLCNNLANENNIDIIVYIFNFMDIAFQILDENKGLHNKVVVSGYDSNNAYNTMQYLSYKAIKQCNKAILFTSDNYYLNEDIYADIDQMHESNKYSSIEIITENNTIYNVTKKHNYLAYKYKQYSKEGIECKLLLEKYKR